MALVNIHRLSYKFLKYFDINYSIEDMNNSTIGLFIFGFTSVILAFIVSRKKKPGDKEKGRNSLVLYPPFPAIIVKILKSTKLCFLSTTNGAGNIIIYNMMGEIL